jgi:hypothetical protein
MTRFCPEADIMESAAYRQPDAESRNVEASREFVATIPVE